MTRWRNRLPRFARPALAMVLGAGVEARHAETLPGELRPACPDPTVRAPETPPTCGG